MRRATMGKWETSSIWVLLLTTTSAFVCYRSSSPHRARPTFDPALSRQEELQRRQQYHGPSLTALPQHHDQDDKRDQRRPHEGGGEKKGQRGHNFVINQMLVQGEKNLDALLAVVDEYVHEFSSVNCGTALNRISKAAMKEKRNLRGDDRLVRLVQRSFEQIDTAQKTEFCNTLNGIGKLRYNPGRANLDRARDRALILMPTFDPVSYSNLINSFGRLRYEPGTFFKNTFIRMSQEHLSSFGSVELASLMNGLGWLGLRPPDAYLQDVVGAITRRMPKLKPQEISNILNGFVKIGGYNPGREFLDALVSHAASQIDMFSNQELICCLNAFANLEYHPGDKFLGQLTRVILGKMHTFNGQDFGNTMNAFAKLEVDPSTYAPSFFTDFCRHSIDKLGTDFNSQELSNTLNGLGKFALSFEMSDAYLDSFTRAAMPNGLLRRFIPQAMATTIHAYGRFGYYPGEELMSSMLDQVLEQKEGFTTQGLALVLNGLSKMHYHPGTFFLENIIATVMTKSHVLDWQNVSNVLNALVIFKYKPEPELWESVHEVMVRYVGEVGFFEVAAALYNFAAVGGPGPDATFPLLLERACELSTRILEKQDDELVDGETGGAYRQLYQTHRYVDLLMDESSSVTPELKERFGDLTHRVWDFILSKLKTSVYTSPFQLEVAKQALDPLGLIYDMEVHDGPFTLDFVVRGRKAGVLPVVIEVDGPSHYFRNRQDEETGTTEFKHRLLEAHRASWQGVIVIGAGEWNRATCRVDLVRRKFREAGVDMSAYVPDASGSMEPQGGAGDGLDRRGGPITIAGHAPTRDPRRPHQRPPSPSAPPPLPPIVDPVLWGDEGVGHEEAHASQAGYDEGKYAELSRLRLQELKVMCKASGLKVSGKKAEVVKRLLADGL